MPIYRPSELTAFLKGLDIYPKKGLSQNFLIDGNVLRKILSTAQVEPGDLVLEVGPGPGALTEALLECGAEVWAVEKDSTLAQALQRLEPTGKSLHITCDDILNFSFDTLPKTEKKIKVIANLPYHLTTPILALLFEHHSLFFSCTLMVQQEVAARLTAQAGSKEYGSLSLFTQFYSSPTYATTVRANCFYPVPQVDSAVVHLQLNPPPLSNEEMALFFEITRHAFEHRRKMLRGSLKPFFAPEITEHTLKAIGLHAEARPEDLSLSQFLQFFSHTLPFRMPASP